MNKGNINYHKTLTTYINSLLKCGFEIKEVIETMPPKEMLEEIDRMKDELRRPMMLLISAKKGKVFETTLVGNESYGSICSGGRYDNLAEKYTNNILPGVGISIGLTRLFFVLKEIGFINNYVIENSIDYLILPIGETIDYCGEVLKSLSEKGYKSIIYFEDESLKKKMNYANKLGVNNVILIGEEEVEKDIVKVKNMNSGYITSIDYKLI